MSVTHSVASRTAFIPSSFSDLFRLEESSQTLVVCLGRRKEMTDFLFARCREEIARRVTGQSIETIVFDLKGLVVLPSSALGLIAAVSQGETKVRVINASHPAREDFQLTGLDRMIELEPPAPPGK